MAKHQPARTQFVAQTPFVGRGVERAELRRALEQMANGTGSLVMLAGEPGVGKTRLVSEMAVHAADRGLRVLTGRAYESEGMPPYLPFTEALTQCLRACSDEELLADLNGNTPYLARLLPELRRRLPDITDPAPMGPETERYLLFDAVSDFLLKVAARKAILLSLDDLHWADGTTLLLLQHVARRLPESSVLIVSTYRDVEVDERHPLMGLLGELTRQHLGLSITLRPFDREESQALIKAVLGKSPASQVADALYTAAEGNPLFTEELVRHLREQGRDLTDPEVAVTDWTIPESVRQLISKRLARLGRDATRILAYASVLGRDLSLAKVAAVTRKEEGYVLDLLDEAIEARILREGAEGCTFIHPLIHETLYRGLSVPRRRQLHRRVAEALEQLYQQELGAVQLADLAHHFFQAAPGGDVDKAIYYAVRAAEQALSQVAYQEGARLYQMALQALDLKQEPDEEQRCELLLGLGDALARAGASVGARETFQRAAGTARKLAAPERLARAALGFGRSWSDAGVVDEILVSLLEEALRAMGRRDSALRARVLGRMAVEFYYSDSREQRESLSQEALDMARRVGEAEALADALSARYLALWGPQNVRDRLDVATEAVRLAEQVGNKELALLAHMWCFVALLELGDIAGAEAETEAYTRLAGELRQPRYLWYSPAFRAMRALLDGRLAEVEGLAQHALSIGQQAQDSDALQAFGVQMFALRREQGRLQEVEGTVKAFVQQYPVIPSWRCGLAFLYAQLGRQVEALAQFGVLAANDFGDLRQDAFWMAAVALLSDVCAFLGDARRGAALYELLTPYAGRNVVVGRALACLGSASRHLGLLATTMRHWKDAERHFKDALEMNERMGARAWVAWTQHDYAAMLLARRQPRDRKKALEFLTQALQAAQQMGLEALEGRAQALLGAL